eukprot:jgi/Tetstr1/444647/TSEL_032495.t1
MDNNAYNPDPYREEGLLGYWENKCLVAYARYRYDVHDLDGLPEDHTEVGDLDVTMCEPWLSTPPQGTPDIPLTIAIAAGILASCHSSQVELGGWAYGGPVGRQASLGPYLAERGSLNATSSACRYDHFLNDARGSGSYAAAVCGAWGRLQAATAGHLSDADARVMEREAEAASGSQKELAAF